MATMTWFLSLFDSPPDFEAYAAPFPDGAQVLYGGHSFFAPVAELMDEAATYLQNNDGGGNSDLSLGNHQMVGVFAGGQNGSPQRLWENRSNRRKLLKYLRTGRAELFGLTVHIDSSVDDYERWYNAALRFNTDTEFFIGVPWVPEIPNADNVAQVVVQTKQRIDLIMNNLVTELRESYPENNVYAIDYGTTAAVMLYMFEQDDLPDIDKVLCDKAVDTDPTKCLFTDASPGHAGPMLKEMSALVWLYVLYGLKPTDILDVLPSNHNRWNATSVETITNAVINANAPLN